MGSLTLFDKIRIASCATKRAEQYYKDNDRFKREYSTVALWKEHRIYNYTPKDSESPVCYSLY
jgi:hypothetical protein